MNLGLALVGYKVGSKQANPKYGTYNPFHNL